MDDYTNMNRILKIHEERVNSIKAVITMMIQEIVIYHDLESLEFLKEKLIKSKPIFFTYNDIKVKVYHEIIDELIKDHKRTNTGWLQLQDFSSFKKISPYLIYIMQVKARSLFPELAYLMDYLKRKYPWPRWRTICEQDDYFYLLWILRNSSLHDMKFSENLLRDIRIQDSHLNIHIKTSDRGKYIFDIVSPLEIIGLLVNIIKDPKLQ